MLQHTFAALEREFSEDSDACIDAAKAIVECACRVIIDNLDNPTSPVKPAEENPPFGAWVSAAVRVLELSEPAPQTHDHLRRSSQQSGDDEPRQGRIHRQAIHPP
jgi:hypothetical protein